MINLISIFNGFLAILSNNLFCLIIETIACCVSIAIGFLLVKAYITHNELAKKHTHSFYFLLIILVGMIMSNIAWIMAIIYKLEILSFSLQSLNLIIAIAWAANLVEYQALGLFIENLLEQKFTFKIHQKILLGINCIFLPLSFYIQTCFALDLHTFISTSTIFRVALIIRALLILPSIGITLFKLQNKNIPVIVKKQLTIFLQYIIVPHLFFECIQYLPAIGSQGYQANFSGIVSILSTIFMTVAIIFCTKNLMRFRFFNFSNKVQDTTKSSLTGDFKDTVLQLSLAKTPQELLFITQNFLRENFQVAPENICLNLRYRQQSYTTRPDNFFDLSNNIVERFITKDDRVLSYLLREYHILVVDEIMFDAYYSPDEHHVMLAQFLQQISSEIFAPMYDQENIIAYLTIKKSIAHKFYSSNEQNKISIFCTYLASAVNIMHNNNSAALTKNVKNLKEELFFKHQETNQYRESIKYLIKQRANAQVGIFFYKDGRFTIGNEAAQRMLTINLNQQKKHPATVTIFRLVQQVESYRTAQTAILYDNHNKQLMVSAVPHLDYQGGIILTIHYPDTSDIIKAQIDLLQDPSQVDYLLYLDTTQNGKLINQIIPGNSEALLNFKLSLLKISLQKKAILIQSHVDDLQSMVEIIHHISLRSLLHIIDLKPTETNHDLSVKLFGLNPMLSSEPKESLLLNLDKKGTLFIKNVELLDLETQNKLAHFIKYGLFTMIKSEQKLSSDVRIICSASQNPQVLVEQNKLSALLYEELAETNLVMPSLLTMDLKDIHELIEGIAHQAVEASHFATLLQMSKRDKDELVDKRPASLYEFKLKIQTILTQKSKEFNIYQETHFAPEFNITNPKLLHAAKLGKHALKDSELMSLLWAQFQCQNKIAQFLGVNRSSVNRRCKEYNLM